MGKVLNNLVPLICVVLLFEAFLGLYGTWSTWYLAPITILHVVVAIWMCAAQDNKAKLSRFLILIAFSINTVLQVVLLIIAANINLVNDFDGRCLEISQTESGRKSMEKDMGRYYLTEEKYLKKCEEHKYTVFTYCFYALVILTPCHSCFSVILYRWYKDAQGEIWKKKTVELKNIEPAVE